MTGMLTNADRDRFAAWLDDCAKSDDELAVQCEQIKEAAMAKKLRIEAMAAKVIAAKLRATEFQTVTVGSEYGR